MAATSIVSNNLQMLNDLSGKAKWGLFTLFVFIDLAFVVNESTNICLFIRHLVDAEIT